MAKNKSGVFESGWGNNFVAVISSSYVTVVSASAEGYIINWIGATATITAVATLDIAINDGAADWIIGNIPMTVSAGNAADASVKSVDCLDITKLAFLPLDINGKTVYLLAPNYTLKAKARAALTSGQINVNCGYKSITKD